MELEPRRYDRILNEAPDDVLGAIFGFLLFESSTAAKDDDGVRAPLPPLLPQSAAAAALGLPEHADLAKLRERAAVAASAVSTTQHCLLFFGPGSRSLPACAKVAESFRPRPNQTRAPGTDSKTKLIA